MFIQVTTGVGRVRLVNVNKITSIEESRQIKGGTYIIVDTELSYHVKESLEDVGRLVSCPIIPQED
jgi:hypothetical protein